MTDETDSAPTEKDALGDIVDRKVRTAQRIALQEMEEKWLDEMDSFTPGDERKLYREAFGRARGNAWRALCPELHAEPRRRGPKAPGQTASREGGDA